MKRLTFSMTSASAAAEVLLRLRGGSSAIAEDTNIPSPSSREGLLSSRSSAALALGEKAVCQKMSNSDDDEYGDVRLTTSHHRRKWKI
jgi:hypothetical protein